MYQWGQQGFPGVDPATQQAQQMYWQQYYAGYGAPQQYFGYGQPVPGMPPTSVPGPSETVPSSTSTTASGVNPIPPVEPPREEPPPLPAEPPPEEDKQTSLEEQNKLNALQMQAAQWQQQKQWQEYQLSLVQYQQQLQQWTMQQAAMLEQVNKEEAEFDIQYNDWLKQYNDWREQNKNHPNKDQYQQYEKQWRQYEEQMAQKREYILSRKRALLASQQQAQAAVPVPPAGMQEMGATPTAGIDVSKLAAGMTQPTPPVPSLPSDVRPPMSMPYASGFFGHTPVMSNPSAMQQSQPDFSAAVSRPAVSSMYQPGVPVSQGQQYTGMSGFGRGRLPGVEHSENEFGHGGAFPPPSSQGFGASGPRFPGMGAPPRDQGPRFGSTESGVRGIRPGLTGPGKQPGFGARAPLEADNDTEQHEGTGQMGMPFPRGPASLRGIRPLNESVGGRGQGPGIGGPRGGAFGNRPPNLGGPRGPGGTGQQRFGFGQARPLLPHGIMMAGKDGDGTETDEGAWGSEQQESEEGFEQPPFGSFGRGGIRPGFGPPRFHGGMSGPRQMLRGPRPPGNQPPFGQHQEVQNFGEDQEAEDLGEWGEDIPEESDGPGGYGMRGFQPEGPRFPIPGSQQGNFGRGARLPFGGNRGQGPRLGDARGPIPKLSDVRVPGPRLGNAPKLSPKPMDIRGPGPGSLRPGAPWRNDVRAPFWGAKPGFDEETEEHGQLETDETVQDEDTAEAETDFPIDESAGFEGEEDYGNDYGETMGTGFGKPEMPPRFGMPNMRGPRPFGFQRPPGFGHERPRFEGRGPGGGFGPRGPFGLRPRLRGPVPLMDLRVQRPAVPASAMNSEQEQEQEYGEEAEEEEEAEIEQEGIEQEASNEFGEESQPGSGVGADVPGNCSGARPPLFSGLTAGLRGFSNLPWKNEPGSLMRPRGPRMTDSGQVPRFPGPHGMPGSRGPMPRFPRPGFESPGGLGPRGFPQGPFSRFPRFGGPRFGEIETEGVEGDDDFNAGEDFTNTADDDFMGQESTQWGAGNNAGISESWKNETAPSSRFSDQARPGDGKDMSVQRDSGVSEGDKKALKLFSEREHELIKKAAEELMQKKLPSLDIITKMISPSADKSKVQPSPLAAVKESQPSEDTEGFDDANLGEPRFESTEQPFMQGRQFAEERPPFREGFERPFSENREFMGDRNLFPRGGFRGGRRPMEESRSFEDPAFLDERERNRPFPPDRHLSGEFGDERRFPEDRPFAGDRPDFMEPRPDVREFDRNFPPRPDFERGPRWGGPRGPRDDSGFNRPPREEPGFPMDEQFHGPRDDHRDFGGPPGFDMNRGRFEGRRPPPEWEHEDPMFRMGRGGRLPRPPGFGREFVEPDEFPPRPPAFGFGRGMPPEMRRPMQSESAHVIDYGHGQPNEELEFRGQGENRGFGEDDRRHDRRGPPDFDMHMDRGPMPPGLRRGDGRPFPDERGFEGVGHRSRSRSPTWRRDSDPFGHERSPFDRMRDRPRDHDGDRFPPMRSGFDGDRMHPPGLEQPERDIGFGRRDREMNDFRTRPGQEPRGFPPAGEPFNRGGPGRLPPPQPLMEEIRIETVVVDDLLTGPGRLTRPDHMVVIIRGPPGAGKTYVSKLLKDKEVANGGTAPRMLCLDDYFVVEVEKVVAEPDTGKKVKKMVMEYEYDATMEPSYRSSFLKSFKRQIDDCYFNFIIVDAVFDKVAQLEEFWSYAKSKGFQVYVAEVHADVNVCTKRNTHQRKQAEIQKIIDEWEETPKHYIRLDIRSLLQDAAIEEVEMEDTTNNPTEENQENSAKDTEKKDEEEEEVEMQGYQKSKWELDTSEQQLDKLDGIRLTKKKTDTAPQRLEDYLQLPDDYESRTSQPGKKRVRWADIEERKDQLRRREIGFVVGQTDWAKMTDESYAERALNRTKYI